MFLARVAALLLVLSVTLGERVYLTVSGNPVDLFALGFVSVACLLWVLDSLILRPQRVNPSVSGITIGPLFVLYACLPLVGVAIGWYRETSLYLWIVIAVPLAILSLSRAARLHRLHLDRILFTMILVHGVYGLGQTMARIGILPQSLWGAASRWDAASQAALSDAYVIYGRSTGLFINANVFGLWSCGAILAGAVLMKGWLRSISIVLGLLGVVGSQSRTAWVGLAILVVVAVFSSLRSGRMLGTVFMTIIMIAPVLVILWSTGIVAQFAESNLLTRLGNGLDVLGGGISADGNLAARVDAWDLALQFAARYPFGTFGPPQALFGTFIDNQYVSLFLQGGVVLVIAYIVFLISPLVLVRHKVPLAGALGVASVLIAVSSLTMLPIESTSAVVPFWLLTAVAFARWTEEESRLEPTDIVAGRQSSLVRPKLNDLRMQYPAHHRA